LTLAIQQPSPYSREVPEPALLARVFAGISEPTRLHIILVLLDGERNVSELVSAVGSSQGRVSMHLQCLRWCGFVESERRGKYVYYRVRDERVQELINLARAFAASYQQELASCTVLEREATRSETEPV
jgi:ArsR family transcriptional regulator, cadmium/lead-responsive transcriptional repressor